MLNANSRLMLNANSLFNSSVDDPTFLHRIDVSKALAESIKEARRIICDWLRMHLPRGLIELGYPEAAVTPRFFIQGSASYRTLNGPAWPGQQVDLDIGVYLPLSGLMTTGTPRQASSVFFAAMELALAPLMGTQKWKLDLSKPTCVRVIIHNLAHIDLPLYVIPDEEFVKLSMAQRVDHVGAEALRDEMWLESEDLWENLPVDHVHLAHRTENWKKSDARPVKTWFEDAVARFGEQLRRVVRYVKALRDHLWSEGGGPSSLLLTTATVAVFQQRERRDDLAVLNVLGALPNCLRNGVAHPVDADESLTSRLGQEGVWEAASRFDRHALAVRVALAGSCARTACSVLVDQFGKRFPNDPSRIQKASEVEHQAALGSSRASEPASPEQWASRVALAAGKLTAAPKPWGKR